MQLACRQIVVVCERGLDASRGRYGVQQRQLLLSTTRGRGKVAGCTSIFVHRVRDRHQRRRRRPRRLDVNDRDRREDVVKSFCLPPHMDAPTLSTSDGYYVKQIEGC